MDRKFLYLSLAVLVASLIFFYAPQLKKWGQVEAQTCVSPTPQVQSYFNIAIPRNNAEQNIPINEPHDLCFLQGIHAPNIPPDDNAYKLNAHLKSVPDGSKNWVLAANANVDNQTADVMCLDWE